MVNQARTGPIRDGSAMAAPRPRSAYGRRVAAGILLVVALAAVSCGGDDLEKNSEGFNIEPAAEPGPHAFTPSVASEDVKNAMGPAIEDGGESAAGPAGPCNTEKFLQELQSRPDAYREWGKVLGIPQDQIPAFVRGLSSATLSKDTKVTNHGLKDGHAYPRQSVLTAGTAVLVDMPGGPSASTTTLSAPPGTAPGGAVIVTRCKCGNPLLPPGDPKAPETSLPPETESPATSAPGTRPGTTRPSGASTTHPATSTTRSATSTIGRGGTSSTEP